jgi:hypothetical protein
MKYILSLFAVSLLTALPALAGLPQPVTFDWAETNSSFGDGAGTITISGSSSLDLNPSDHDYTVQAFTGVIDGNAITSLDGSTNYLVFSVSSSPTTGSFLGTHITFDIDGSNYYLYSPLNFGTGDYTIRETGGSTDSGSDAFTLSTPEPTSTALLAVVGLGLGWHRWRTARS